MRPLAVLAAACLLTVAGCPDRASAPPPTPSPSAQPAETGGEPLPVGQAADVLVTSRGEVRIKPIRHATLELSVAGKALYFDPVHDGHYDGLPKADVVFVTDIHPDHLDTVGLDAVMRPDTVLVVPPAVADKLAGARPHVTVMKNGDVLSSLPAVPAIGVEAVPMYNLRRGPAAGSLYHDKGRGNGYVLTFGDKRVYVSGDTECTPEMRALKAIDVAFVCMNLPYTMPPSEAVECVNAFRPKVLYPYHYRDSNLEELRRAAGPVEVRLRDWYPP